MAVTRIPISQAEEKARQLREQLDLSTAEIGLAVRTTNCLEEKGIFTVRDLLKSTPKDLSEHFQLWRKDVGRGLWCIGKDRLSTTELT